MLSIYRAGEIDLFENLDIVHIRLLVVVRARNLCLPAPSVLSGRETDSGVAIPTELSSRAYRWTTTLPSMVNLSSCS